MCQLCITPVSLHSRFTVTRHTKKLSYKISRPRELPTSATLIVTSLITFRGLEVSKIVHFERNPQESDTSRVNRRRLNKFKLDVINLKHTFCPTINYKITYYIKPYSIVLSLYSNIVNYRNFCVLFL